MPHDKVYVVCEDMCLEEGMTKEQIADLVQETASSEIAFKGDVATLDDLPDSANLNDTYYVQSENCRYTWTGTEFKQSSPDESAYSETLSEIESNIEDIQDEFSSARGTHETLTERLNMVDTTIAANKTALEAADTAIKNDLGDDYIFDADLLTHSGYITAYGNIVETTAQTFYYSDVISTVGIKKITITECGYRNTGCVIAFFTAPTISNTNFISGISLESALTEPLEVTVPSNAKYMAFSAVKSYGFIAYTSLSSVVQNISDKIDEVVSDIADLETGLNNVEISVSELLEDKNIINYDRTILTEKGYITVHGVISPSESDIYHYSDLIEISVNSLKIESPVRNTGSIVAFYDETENFISGVSYPTVSTDPISVTVPSNAKYMRFSAAYLSNQGTVFTFSAYTTVKDAVVQNAGDIKNIKSQMTGIPETPKRIMSNLVISSDTKIVLLGDSITQGVGSTGYVSFTKTIDGTNYEIRGNGPDYPYADDDYVVGDFLYESGNKKWYEATSGHGWSHLLKNYLEEKFNCTVKNYGMSGISSFFIPLVIPTVCADADIVFIMIGTNDRARANGKSEMFTHIPAAVNTLREAGKKVILMSSIPCSLTYENPEIYNFHMEDVDHFYSYFDNLLETEHISLYSEFINYCKNTGVTIDSLLSDGLHPSDAGYEVMFKLICDKIGLPYKRDGANW